MILHHCLSANIIFQSQLTLGKAKGQSVILDRSLDQVNIASQVFGAGFEQHAIQRAASRHEVVIVLFKRELSAFHSCRQMLLYSTSRIGGRHLCPNEVACLQIARRGRSVEQRPSPPRDCW